jgi:serine/threonine protein kinase/ABC-type phosphate/phosphonate transport system substrate-binding protein
MDGLNNMIGASKCHACGAAIPPDAPLGQCPSCLIDCADNFAWGDDAFSARQELPRRFGDYELLRQIGCGGMGLVYEARHIRLKRRVAIKMVRPDLASRRFLRRFLIEGEAAARLDHPAIIPIYEIKEDGTESFLAMQFIEGETLKDKIRNGEIGLGKPDRSADGPRPQQPRDEATLSNETNARRIHTAASRDGSRSAEEVRRRERAIASLIADLARAVHHAHERGVFHRDLKPGNILVDTAGRPHIADFGVAKIIQEQDHADGQSTLTVPGATLGTPEYMAPEQASGSGIGDTTAIGAADIYSLGAILYELLTGRPPFTGSSNLETLQKVRHGDLKRPRALNLDAPRDLETICLKCLEKNPNARYATADALANDLSRWLDGKPILARPANLPVRVQRWVKRNPVGTALISSLFFGLGISLGFVVVLSDRMRTSEVNKGLEREIYLQKFNDSWAVPANTNMVIPSRLLAEIRDQAPRQFIEGRDLLLRFGMTVDQDPITRAYSVAPILGQLETRMGEELKRGVFIDLHISKTSHLESQLLSNGDADIERLDALSYVEAKAADAGIVPILVENDADEVVFCVQQNSDIASLSQLAGKSLGFGDSNSAVTVLAKYSLLTNGIRKSDLGDVEYFTSLAVLSKTNLPDFGSAEIMTDMREVKAGREAVRNLLQGKVDAAVTLKRYFEIRRYRGTGLRLISRFPGVPEVFAARAGLDPEVVKAFQNAMLSLKESPGLGTLSSFRTVTGVIATNDNYFDGLRDAWTNVQHRFDSSVGLAKRR